MDVGVRSDFQKVPFFFEFIVKERIEVSPGVVWDVAVENIGKYERRRTSTYRLGMLAGYTTGTRGRQPIMTVSTCFGGCLRAITASKRE